MHENFKHVHPTPLTKQEVAEDDDYVLWEKESLLSTDNMCGVGPCRGPALQGLASRKLYLVVFCSLCIIQGMYYAYMVSVLTTIEKRFAVPSRITGLLMTGHEFSQVVFAVVVSYFGSQGHRPRWVALGMFVSAVACFVSALPEFIFPSLEPTILHSDTCLNHTATNVTDPACSLPISHASSRTAAFVIFLGLFFSGVGSITLYSLGLPYMDDNTSKKKSPAYIGIVAGLRMVGPTLGFLLGAYCTSHYVTLQDVRNLEMHDPRWIGAWWLGFAIIGLLLVLGGLFIAPFPKILPSTIVKRVNEESHLNMDGGEMDYIPDIPAVPRLTELPTALWRLVSNPLFMVYTMGGIFHLLGTVGFFTFLPKYLEAQFRQTASSANMISGFAGFFVMMLSTIGSGFVIQSWRPKPRLLSGWMILVTLIQIVGILACMQITCDSSTALQGITSHSGQIDLNNECNNACHCTTKKFSPVCDNERKLNYFSACHLGCVNFNTTSQSYENCACTTPVSPKGRMPVITSNYCDNSCRAIVLYVGILAFIKFCASSCHVGSILISLRCIEARDKGLAMGFLNTIYCLCAFLPCTIIYGAIVDSTCDIWEESCGNKGNCWVYDPERLRHRFHAVTAGFMAVGMLFHVYLCYQSKRLNLYEETMPSSPKPVKLSDILRRTK